MSEKMQARFLNEIKIKPDQIKELQDEIQDLKRDPQRQAEPEQAPVLKLQQQEQEPSPEPEMQP